MKRPKYIKFTGFTHWSNTWLGGFRFPYDPKEAADGLYSSWYRHWKKVVFPFVASYLKVGGEKIRVKIEQNYD